jgi:hypothetical protein
MEGYMKKVILWTLPGLVLAVFVAPAMAQRGQGARPAAPSQSNAGASTTGLNRAQQVQATNPSGKASQGLTTATANAAPQAGGQGQGAAHGKKKGKKKPKTM